MHYLFRSHCWWRQAEPKKSTTYFSSAQRRRRQLNKICPIKLLMKTSKDDESTKYSQSSCDVAGSSARFSSVHFYCLLKKGNKKIRELLSTDLELLTRLELVTSSLPRMCSTTWATAAIGGSEGIRTPVGLHPNGFQDRLVMTTSIRFHNKRNLRSLIKPNHYSKTNELCQTLRVILQKNIAICLITG